jgi:hypothetical protein
VADFRKSCKKSVENGEKYLILCLTKRYPALYNMQDAENSVGLYSITAKDSKKN